MSQRIVIAIDGPSGAGKSTVARAVADKLGFIYVDTGAMYRAVALWALRRGISHTDMYRLEQLSREADIQFEARSRRVLLNGEDVTEAIRDQEVSTAASEIAAIPAVRRALVEQQRRLGQNTSVVMEGRDIGSVVFPDATLKIFLDAPAPVRAGRRTREIQHRGEAQDEGAVAREMEERDRRDRSRPESPLVQAPDAVYIDSAELAVEEVVEAILRVVRSRTTNGKEYLH